MNNDFISYFLSLLHEEGNKYLQILNKTTHATPATQYSTPPSHPPITNITNITPTSKNNRHEHFENKLQNMNTSLITPKSNSKQRKISLQPLTNTPNSNGSFTNDHNGYYKNRRNNNSLFTSPNTYSDNIIMNQPTSPIVTNQSPKHISSSYSSKLASKPTLFDFISTPIKSPKQGNNNILEPLTSLPEASILPSAEQISKKLSLLNKSKNEKQENLVDENNEILKSINQKDLGLSVKTALNAAEMKKLEDVAKVYSDLILSMYNAKFI